LSQDSGRRNYSASQGWIWVS